jgi:hypothetical protein
LLFISIPPDFQFAFINPLAGLQWSSDSRASLKKRRITIGYRETRNREAGPVFAIGDII